MVVECMLFIKLIPQSLNVAFSTWVS